MKKFQKILSAGLILAQVFSNSCIVSANSDDNTKQQYVLIRASEDDSEVTINPNRKQKSSRIDKKISKCIGLTLSVLLAAETGLQIGCSTSSKFAKKWAGYIDKGLSETINTEASLRKLSKLIDENKFKDALELCKESLTPKQLDFKRAAKLAALGFADYICVSNYSSQWCCFFLPTGWSLSTSMGIYNYLQYLINKCNKKFGEGDEKSGEGDKKSGEDRSNDDCSELLGSLSSIKEIVYEHGVPYTAWTKLKATSGDAWTKLKATSGDAWTKLKATSGDAWNAAKHLFGSNGEPQILPNDYDESLRDLLE